MSRGNELFAALVNAQAGGFVAQPPGLDGEPGLGIAGISGVSRGRVWDAAASAHAPDLGEDAVSFVALADGTLIIDRDVSDGSLAPLADAIETSVDPPYRAAALRTDGDVWAAVAQSVAILELPGEEEDVIDLTSFDGQRELTVNGEISLRSIAALDALIERHGDVAIHAERVDGELFAVDVFPL